MKNRRALFAVPYVGWMALFVVAPIILVVASGLAGVAVFAARGELK